MSFITAYSFIYNGINSIDYNVIISWLNSSDTDTTTNGLNREIKKTTNRNRLKSNIYGTENADNIIFNFSIFKINGEEITRTESININEWLTSSSLPQLLKFNDCDSYPLHYYAICTYIKDIVVGGKLIGKELTFETNSSFAFSEKREKIFNYKGSDKYYDFSLNNSSGSLYYPIVSITTSPSSSVIIENITDKRSVKINIPDVGLEETNIIINSEKMTILDNNGILVPANDLGWNDTYKSYVSCIDKYITNIYWVRLLKGINNFKIKTSNNCTFKIIYEYPRKAGCF